MHSSTKPIRKSARLKAHIALEALKGTSVATLAQANGASEEEVESYVNTFIDGGKEAFISKRGEASRGANVARLHQKIGELLMQLEGQPGSTNGHDEDESL